MFHVKQMKKHNYYYCTAKDRLVTGELFSVYFNNDRSVAKTKIDPEEDMYRFYKSKNYRSHKIKPNSITDKIYFLSRRLMFYYKYKIISPYKKDFNLLDYGCGNGDFLNYMSEKKIKVTGVEKSLSSQKICQSRGLNVFSSVKKLEQNSYSLITLWHVLEHVSNPSKCINTLSGILSKDGMLIIAVPNIQSIDSQFFKEEWEALDIPRHLWHFTSKGLVDLLKTEQFVLIKKRPLFLDAYYISLLSAKRKKMFSPWIVALFIGTISNIIGIYNGNYSSSVYVFKKKA